VQNFVNVNNCYLIGTFLNSEPNLNRSSMQLVHYVRYFHVSRSYNQWLKVTGNSIELIFYLRQRISFTNNTVLPPSFSDGWYALESLPRKVCWQMRTVSSAQLLSRQLVIKHSVCWCDLFTTHYANSGFLNASKDILSKQTSVWWLLS
jgi:hypothetical protein